MKLICRIAIMFSFAFSVLGTISTHVTAQDIPADYQEVLKSLDRKGDYKAGAPRQLRKSRVTTKRF